MSSSTSTNNNITHPPYRQQQQQQHPVNTNNSINIVCPEQRKGLLKTGLALAGLLVVANVSLLLTLVQQQQQRDNNNNGGVMILGDDGSSGVSSRAMMTTTETSFTTQSSSSLLPRRLPPDFRYPQRPEECPASLHPLTLGAPASTDSKISYAHQKQFVMGGYQQIDKGSGDYKLVGPIVSFLSHIQHSSLGIFGTVAEVGVHHGRFTGALFVTARSTEKLVAADLFEDLQYQNIDTSGYGNRQAFDRGLQSYGLDPDQDVHLIYTGSTTDLPLDWHLSKKNSHGDDGDDESFEPFRMISVDAGHTDALTFNDLELAFCNALKGGIIILDDFFHNLWPGVTEGFFQFAAMGPIGKNNNNNNNNNMDDGSGVYPFLRCEGKNFVTNDKEMHKKYYTALKKEPKFKFFLSAYAHQVRGSKVKYMMNGVEYLKCDSEKLSKETMHLLWNSVIY